MSVVSVMHQAPSYMYANYEAAYTLSSQRREDFKMFKPAIQNISYRDRLFMP